jgi:hypothetical protein
VVVVAVGDLLAFFIIIGRGPHQDIVQARDKIYLADYFETKQRKTEFGYQ